MKKNTSIAVLIVLFIFSCKSKSENDQVKTKEKVKTNFKIAVGSCNRQNLSQEFWATIEKDSADIFIWGGDNIYADTANMELMQRNYETQKSNEYYQSFVLSLPYGILGVWDDHDYGKNDAGKEWAHKEDAKKLFMDFLDIEDTHPMAKRPGTFSSRQIELGDYSIKFYLLDTRYFRDGLLEANQPSKRYQPHFTKDSTLLGKAQWNWLTKEFEDSTADFNVVVSSIQFLSNEHGFETWGNFPHEVEKMQDLIITHQLKNVLFLSGDRHISEFSQKNVEGLNYPLTDFTSSGLTHSYASFSGEPNPYRVGEVTFQKSYGIVEIDFTTNLASFQIKSTDDGKLLQELELQL